MAEEPDGQADLRRLDRIERAIEALIHGHEGSLAPHKQLLAALLERRPGSPQ